MYTPETVNRIEQLRGFAQQRRLTLEEQQEALRLIRGERVKASIASSASKSRKAASEAPDGAAILAQLFSSIPKPE